MHTKKFGTIAFVVDERLSREKLSLAMRYVNAMRQIAHVDLLTGVAEDELIKKLEAKPYQLVLAPWYRYLSWSRVEAFYGLTRTTGPTFAGYFADQVLPYEIGEQAEHLRAILLDFTHSKIHEAITVVRSLLHEQKRSGVRPFFDSAAPIYFENWYGGQGLGGRMDAVLGLPEIANSDWAKRANAIRICLSSLWSLIYEEGPGKGELAQATTTKSPKAYFQVAVDNGTLVLRLCYAMSGWNPKTALGVFWPDVKRTTAPAQLLLRYADFVRVHTVADSNDVEVAVVFFASGAAELAPTQLHTLWVEPLAAQLVVELPFELHGPNLKALPGTAGSAPAEGRGGNSAAGKDSRARERFIFNAAVKIKELTESLKDKDETIRDLRSGGVGTAPPLPPPDAEGLLEAFQERFFDARYQIRQLEIQIVQAELGGASPQELEAIRKKISALAQREQGWIKKIAATLEVYREAKKKDGSGG